LSNRRKDKGMGFSDRCHFCHEFGEKVEPYLCEECRDKIIRWLNSKTLGELADLPLRHFRAVLKNLD